jgi:uncharacterized OB-fold protein
MSDALPDSEELLVRICGSCAALYLIRPGPCPVCGGSESRAGTLPGVGRILAATELAIPAEGWTAPHRIALVEIAEGIRALVEWMGADLPHEGDTVGVRLHEGRYQGFPRTP